MRRRDSVTGLGGAITAYAWSDAVLAQSRSMLRLGVASILPQNIAEQVANNWFDC